MQVYPVLVFHDSNFVAGVFIASGCGQGTFARVIYLNQGVYTFTNLPPNSPVIFKTPSVEGYVLWNGTLGTGGLQSSFSFPSGPSGRSVPSGSSGQSRTPASPQTGNPVNLSCRLVQSNIPWFLGPNTTLTPMQWLAFNNLIQANPVTSAYTVAPNDRRVYIDGSQGKFPINLPNNYPENTPLTLHRVDHGRGRIPVVSKHSRVGKLDTCNCHNSITIQRNGKKWH